MAEDKKIATGYIGNALRSVADNHTTTFTDEVFDTERQKYQNEVNTDLETTDNETKADLEAEKARAKTAEEAIIFDVSAHNNGAVFESISALLGNANLSTLIPAPVRRGGMTIKFIQGSEQSSDNKYVQYRLMAQNFTTNIAQWQGVDDEPAAGSDNLVKSRGIRTYVRNGFFAKDETIISDTSDKIVFEDDNGNTIVTVDDNGINANNLFKNGIKVLDSNDKTELERSINSIATHELKENSEQAIVFEDDNGIQYSKILLDENPVEEEAIVIEDNDGNEKLKVNKLGVYINGVKHKSPSVIIVDPNGNGDYTTIGSAISNTHDGDTIFVMDGVYEEHINMYNKERHLVGMSKESVIVVTHDGLRSNNPCDANVGSIENMTFIAMIDEIPEDYYDRPSIQRSTYGIHIDARYTSSARHRITIRNCRCISYAHSGIGIGVRYNQTIEIIDCELITYKASAGGFLMHNDDFYPDSNGAEVIVNNCICKGVDKAVTVGSLNNNALCTLSFVNTTCYTSENGVTNIITEPTNKRWGTDISLGIISHGNNINNLNY